MKLSEAIMLGDPLKSANPHGFISCFGGACALRTIWPWFPHAEFEVISDKYRAVCRGTMTLEQLVDYVRSIEPAEESTLPDISLAEPERLEEIDAEREGLSLGGYRDPAEDRSFA